MLWHSHTEAQTDWSEESLIVGLFCVSTCSWEVGNCQDSMPLIHLIWGNNNDKKVIKNSMVVHYMSCLWLNVSMSVFFCVSPASRTMHYCLCSYKIIVLWHMITRLRTAEALCKFSQIYCWQFIACICPPTAPCVCFSLYKLPVSPSLHLSC